MKNAPKKRPLRLRVSAVKKPNTLTAETERRREEIDFPWITEQLRPLAVPLADILLDPRNARHHDAKNLKAIQGSLRRFGQLQPLVVNRATKIIAAGNGRLICARRLGWTHIAVVYVDQDAQSHAGYALADNRTAELAEWIQTLVLEEIAAIQTHERDLADELLLDELRAEVLPKEKKKGLQSREQIEREAQWQVLVVCRDEAHQVELLGKFQADGLDTRAFFGKSVEPSPTRRGK
jgi:ParB-like chromosome segregation protein Spo0J